MPTDLQCSDTRRVEPDRLNLHQKHGILHEMSTCSLLCGALSEKLQSHSSAKIRRRLVGSASVPSKKAWIAYNTAPWSCDWQAAHYSCRLMQTGRWHLCASSVGLAYRFSSGWLLKHSFQNSQKKRSWNPRKTHNILTRPRDWTSPRYFVQILNTHRICWSLSTFRRTFKSDVVGIRTLKKDIRLLRNYLKCRYKSPILWRWAKSPHSQKQRYAYLAPVQHWAEMQPVKAETV